MNRGQVADIIGRSALSPYQKLILLCYLSHLPSAQAIGAGLAWPGLQTLATWASCSRSTAQQARAELLALGILVAVERSEHAVKVRLDTTALQAWTSTEPGAVSRQGAATRHGGVPPAGTGGAVSRHGGVPPAGTEPSSENPPKQPSIENLGGADAPALSQEKKSRRQIGEEDEAQALFRRLERLRADKEAEQGRTARPSSEALWMPKLRKALKTFGSPGAVEDAWVWMLRSPAAAWHRGEDGKGPDRTADYATLLNHQVYATRRSWKGPDGPTKMELEEAAEWRAGDGRPEPTWLGRMRAAGHDTRLGDANAMDDGRRAEERAEGAAKKPADTWVCPF